MAAIHQSDVYVVSPIHFKGKLMGWSATFVHVMDIGAMSPGGNSPDATEICHEGIRIPGIKLVERGELRKDLFDAFINMTRQPVMVGLDLKCEIAANNVAKSRMQALYEQFGPELVAAVSQEMLHYSEVDLEKENRRDPRRGVARHGHYPCGRHAGKSMSTLKKTGDALVVRLSPAAAHRQKRGSTCRTMRLSVLATRRFSRRWPTTCQKIMARSDPSK